jgi:nicotinamidase-related amidase
MAETGILKKSKTAFIIIDVQERLMPVVFNNTEVFENVNRLIEGSKILGVPLLITEQYPKGLGKTSAEVNIPEGQEVIEKVCFSCLLCDPVNEKLKTLGIEQLVLAGVESHICVLKTALDALNSGLKVHVVADAVSSRKEYSKQIALERMRQAGAFIATTEMVLFQLMDGAGTEEFKQISKLIR